ncbi:MAG: hypothetical protein ACKV0T_06135 [Planctomycetales bacterium]
MNLTETVFEGPLKPDGTLEFDQKPDVPPGRVLLRMQPLPLLPEGDPFWQRMREMWAIPRANGGHSDGGVTTLEEVRNMQEEWHEHQETSAK